MIDLYTAATPDGWKVSIALEELELAYTLHAIDMAAGEQKRPAFTAINPNGRIPAIVDWAPAVTRGRNVPPRADEATTLASARTILA